MSSARTGSAAFCVLGIAWLCSGMALGGPADERAGLLLELSMRYGDSHAHFDSATNLVLDAAGMADLPDYSLPYSLALLERGLSISRAKAVVNAVLAGQDTRAGSATQGLFKWYGTQNAPYSRAATERIAPLLTLAHARYAPRLGDDTVNRLGQAMALTLRALRRGGKLVTGDDASLGRLAAVAYLGKALGDTSLIAAAVTGVERWGTAVAGSGRTWGPGPWSDTLRLVALQRIWEVAGPESRAPVERALAVCYMDFAQRVHPLLAGLSGAATRAYPEEYVDAAGVASYLAYRDFGTPLPPQVKPFAAVVALLSYRLPAESSAAVRREFSPYVVETASKAKLMPSRTDTYMHPGFTLGTMTGWCVPESIPVLATFARDQQQPTAYFTLHGAPAHISSFQYGNLALCTLNFDRVGIKKRLTAWVRGYLGSVHDVREVYALGTRWNGEPIAIGARGTVVVKRGGTYLAVTLLECGAIGAELTSRRKPGVLEWQGIGEHAKLCLTIAARREEYPVRRPIDDLRAGFVVQIWDGDQFEETVDVSRWLARSKISQRYASATKKTVQPRDVHPVLEKHKPQPKPTYRRRAQHVHTIEYSYQRGKGDSFVLIEDLRHEEVLGRLRNEEPMENSLWWRSPGLELPPAKTLTEALAPPPAEKPAVAPGAP